ncbi:hypothetical protein HQ403_01995 [Candidatus Kaiserbacteria bacterium]|nr:hypothetical protein [Candidatus Kaiserbacteria bacterium]
MKKIVIMFIGFALGITLGSVTLPTHQDVTQEIIPLTIEKIRLETSKRVRGTIDSINFDKKILTLNYPDEYGLSSINKVDVYFNDSTNFKERFYKAEDNISYSWWNTSGGTYTDMRPGDHVDIVGDDGIKKINVRDISYPQGTGDSEYVTATNSSNSKIKGTIYSINKEARYFILVYRPGYAQSETQKVRIYFNEDTHVGKNVFLQEDGIVYSQSASVSSNLNSIREGQAVYITYDVSNDRLTATLITLGDPYPKI